MVFFYLPGKLPNNIRRSEGRGGEARLKFEVNRQEQLFQKNWDLDGVKTYVSHTHKTGASYLLKAPFNISDEQPINVIWKFAHG